MTAGDGVILCLDAATDVCSVAAVRLQGGVGVVVAERNDGSDRMRSAQLLLPMASQVLEDIGAGQEQVRALVVGTGPGTFTGVRIAVSTARALALALGVSVFGVSTLSALAAVAVSGVASAPSRPEIEAGGEVSLLVPFVDARRGQVFAAFFRERGASSMMRGTPLRVWQRVGGIGAVAVDALIARTAELSSGGPVALAGDFDLFAGCETVAGSMTDGAGGSVHPRLLRLSAEVRAAFLVCGQERLRQPSAGGLGPAGPDRGASDLFGPPLLEALAAALHESAAAEPPPGAVGSPESVRPIYVRPPDADAHIKKMKDPWVS